MLALPSSKTPFTNKSAIALPLPEKRSNRIYHEKMRFAFSTVVQFIVYLLTQSGNREEQKIFIERVVRSNSPVTYRFKKTKKSSHLFASFVFVFVFFAGGSFCYPSDEGGSRDQKTRWRYTATPDNNGIRGYLKSSVYPYCVCRALQS